MRDVLGQVRAEKDVHRAADAHLALEGQARVLGDQRIPTVSAYQILGADRELLLRQAIEAGGGHAVAVLDMAEVFRRHPRLRAAAASRAEEYRLHEGLRQIDHVARRCELMLGARERMLAPAFHAADFLARKALAEHVLAHQVLMHAVHVGFRLDIVPQVAQHLHAALVGYVRARRVGQPALPVHGHVPDAVARQERRRGGSRGARADDQHVGFNRGHASALPCR